MRRDELMKSDRLSDCLVVGSGLLILLTILLTLLAAVLRPAALP